MRVWHTGLMKMNKMSYPSDLSDEQWAIVGPLIRAATGNSGSSGDHECDFLSVAHGLPVALFAARIPEVEDGLLLFLALAAQRSVGSDACGPPTPGSPSSGAGCLSDGGGDGQPKR